MGSVFDSAKKYFLTGASDDAAAAGQIFPGAGLYQVTVDAVDDGDVGRARMTERRAMIDAAETDYDTGTSTFAASSATQAPTITWPKWARECSIHINNGTDQAMGITISVRDASNLISTNAILGNFYNAASDIAAGAVKSYTPGGSGAGASNHASCAALRGNYAGLVLRLAFSPAGSATGDVDYIVIWSS